MKKSLLLAFGLMVVVCLSACGNKDDVDNNGGLDSNGNVVVDKSSDVDTLEDLIEKTPLTLEDLDRIDEYRFPVSYTYTEYTTGGSVRTWEYVYPKWVDHKLLLPVHEKMASREIVSSVMSHDLVTTTADIVLNNWETYSVSYVTDPDTLEYVGASLTTPTSTTSYAFNY